ncbi:MAG: GAF domain-containing protein [Chloroflexi bacterium]|nr:MAG: GAF domain-containing protein [Chloroflexota bacterium]
MQKETFTQPALKPPDFYSISEAQVQEALRNIRWRNFPFVTSSLTVLFILYALIQQFILRENQWPLMQVVALLSALCLIGLRHLFDKGKLPRQWDNQIYFFIAILVFLSMILRLVFTGDAKQSANLAFFLVGVGMLTLSWRWFWLITDVTMLAWLSSALALPDNEWIFYGVVMSAAAITGALAQRMLTQTYRWQEILRIAEERQRRELARRTNQLQTSIAVGQRITSILDLEMLLPQIVALIQESYRLFYVALVLRHEDGQITAVAEAGRNLALNGHTRQIGPGGLIGHVLREGESLRVENLTQHPNYTPAESIPGAQSELILPLRMQERILGVLDLQSDRPGAFVTEEVPVFQQLADQVAVALENAWHYNQVRQFNRHLEEKVAERTHALREAYHRLERLDKTKSDFITIASHELRTPLTIVNMHSQLLLHDDEIAGKNNLVKHIKGIETGVARMEEVVEAMLDIAKIDTHSLELHFSPLNLSLLIRMVCQQFRLALAERRLKLQIEGLQELPEIEGDHDALRKVFYHLVVNAIKYTPDGGEIIIRGASGTDETNEGYVEIVVADTGIGVAPDVQSLIFEKFFQTGEVMLHSSGKTKFKGGGPGLGLAIARGIVEAHNGRIWVESPGYDEETCPGSQFHVRLPVKQGLG